MSSFRAGIPFALLLKLCDAPAHHGHVPDPGPVAPQPRDAGAAPVDAGSEPEAGVAQGLDGAAGYDASAGDAAQPSDASVGEILRAPPGLYRDDDCEILAKGVRAYAPRFPLWADGAGKERFILLPAGAAIDATDPDLWRYPAGTRFYKTFTLDGLKLETRVMEKTSSEYGAVAWRFESYAWLADQSGVQLVEATGRMNVLGTSHDIPSVAQCRSCHSAAGQDAINGFTAIQLNHALPGIRLATLIAEGSLVSPIGSNLLDVAVVPGDARTQAALGYVHSNCGNCHGGPTPRASMTLRLSVGQRDAEATSPYLSTVGQPLQAWTGRSQPNGFPIALRIAPGAPAASGIFARMAARGSRDQMPPMGTEIVDAEGLAIVSAWIGQL
jgi:hypothetical protein